MAGTRSLRTLSVSQLTWPPETIASCYRRSRHQIPTAFRTAPTRVSLNPDVSGAPSRNGVRLWCPPRRKERWPMPLIPSDQTIGRRPRRKTLRNVGAFHRGQSKPNPGGPSWTRAVILKRGRALMSAASGNCDREPLAVIYLATRPVGRAGP
jgi:hypothetical protein